MHEELAEQISSDSIIQSIQRHHPHTDVSINKDDILYQVLEYYEPVYETLIGDQLITIDDPTYYISENWIAQQREIPEVNSFTGITQIARDALKIDSAKRLKGHGIDVDDSDGVICIPLPSSTAQRRVGRYRLRMQGAYNLTPAETNDVFSVILKRIETETVAQLTNRPVSKVIANIDRASENISWLNDVRSA